LKTNKMDTFNSFSEIASQVVNVTRAFSHLGIIIHSTMEISYKWQKVEYINSAVKEDDFMGVGMPFENNVALAMAITQEERNNHVDDHELEMVNKFFNITVTREMISKLGSKYI
jgi:hypothetical protein